MGNLLFSAGPVKARGLRGWSGLPVTSMEDHGEAGRNGAMADADHSAVLRKRPWAVTFFCLLSIGGLVAMPILAGKPGVAEMPDIVRFLGRFHPMVLHLPIGVFSLILFQELGAIFGSRRRVEVTSSLFPLFLGRPARFSR